VVDGSAIKAGIKKNLKTQKSQGNVWIKYMNDDEQVGVNSDLNCTMDFLPENGAQPLNNISVHSVDSSVVNSLHEPSFVH